MVVLEARLLENVLEAAGVDVLSDKDPLRMAVAVAVLASSRLLLGRCLPTLAVDGGPVASYDWWRALEVGVLEHHGLRHIVKGQRVPGAHQDEALILRGQSCPFQESVSSTFTIIHHRDFDPDGFEIPLAAAISIGKRLEPLAGLALHRFIFTEEFPLLEH